MTSPPPSETEDLARELQEIVQARPYGLHGLLVTRLVELQQAAKRSAHLEDARAGCYACRDTVNYKPASQEPDHDRWVHVIATREEWGCVTCERPEVRDALSLTGGKP